jgi:hypothetical protein
MSNTFVNDTKFSSPPGPPETKRYGTVPVSKAQGQKGKGRNKNTQTATNKLSPFSAAQYNHPFMPPLQSTFPSSTLINIEVKAFEAVKAFGQFMLNSMQSNKPLTISLSEIQDLVCILAVCFFDPNYTFTPSVTTAGQTVVSTNYAPAIREFKALAPDYKLPKIIAWIASVCPIGYNVVTMTINTFTLQFKYVLSDDTYLRFRTQFGTNGNTAAKALAFLATLQSKSLNANLEVSNMANLADRYIVDHIINPFSFTYDVANNTTTATLHTNNQTYSFAPAIFYSLVFGFSFNTTYTNKFFCVANFDNIDLTRVIQDGMHQYNHKNTKFKSIWPFGDPKSSVSASASSQEEPTDAFLGVVFDLDGQDETDINNIKFVIENKPPVYSVYDKDDGSVYNVSYEQFCFGNFKLSPSSKIFKGLRPDFRSKLSSDGLDGKKS